MIAKVVLWLCCWREKGHGYCVADGPGGDWKWSDKFTQIFNEGKA